MKNEVWQLRISIFPNLVLTQRTDRRTSLLEHLGVCSLYKSAQILNSVGPCWLDSDYILVYTKRRSIKFIVQLTVKSEVVITNDKPQDTVVCSILQLTLCFSCGIRMEGFSLVLLCSGENVTSFLLFFSISFFLHYFALYQMLANLFLIVEDHSSQ